MVYSLRDVSLPAHYTHVHIIIEVLWYPGFRSSFRRLEQDHQRNQSINQFTVITIHHVSQPHTMHRHMSLVKTVQLVVLYNTETEQKMTTDHQQQQLAFRSHHKVVKVWTRRYPWHKTILFQSATSCHHFNMNHLAAVSSNALTIQNVSSAKCENLFKVQQFTAEQSQMPVITLNKNHHFVYKSLALRLKSSLTSLPNTCNDTDHIHIFVYKTLTERNEKIKNTNSGLNRQYASLYNILIKKQ